MSARDTDELLAYYQAELGYLRTAGQEFAKRHPKVARRLELALDESPDPHVERLIESFAFLTARIQRAVDDEFPEVAAAMLGILYPHFTAPVPSVTVARFEPDPTSGKLTTGHLVARGTKLFAQTGEGVHCRFLTCYPATLWPLAVSYAGFESADRFGRGADRALRITLRDGGDPPCRPERLRFYLNADLRSAGALYELIFGHLREVLVVTDGGDPVRLPADAVRAVGFARDEEVLPYPAHAHPAYRLLQEYFAVPRKFFFFDVAGLDRAPAGAVRDLVLLLDRRPPEWLSVDEDTFQLGCTPVVNLFRRTTDPLRLDHRLPEYRLVGDARRERSTEIHTVLEVTATAEGEAEAKPVAPFYSFRHGRRERAYWHARRVPTGRRDLPGTELRLSFVDLELDPALPEGRTVWAKTLCTNRRLAEQLQAGDTLQIEEAAPLHRISVLHPPTPQQDPPLSGATMWRLVSQLSLNHLSLLDEGDGRALEALQEILRLYGAFGADGARRQVDGIRALRTRRVVRRLGGDAWRGLCRGTEVELAFDEEKFAGGSAFLLGAVLARFLALYASVNSFTQTVIRRDQTDEVWKRWPPMAGEQPVL
ncbi:MAG TPA: type VI secretion system baseplate subunit TssF [Longimicrobium sp.]|jgi:type VI secretion system protein ImpG